MRLLWSLAQSQIELSEQSSSWMNGTKDLKRGRRQTSFTRPFIWEKRSDNQEIDDLVDEWQPTPLVDDPTEFDEETLDSVPMIQGPNGLKVKIQPNGKTVHPYWFNAEGNKADE